MQTETDVIVREVRIAATPETIFEFFTEPEKMVRWKGATAELDARTGGIFRCVFNERDVARGEFVEIDRPRRVVFTWGWEVEGSPVPPGTSVVEITLTPEGAETLVRLEHRGLPQPAVEVHAQGWDLYMPRLAVAAAGGDAGPDPNAKVRE